jgi:hypothetical protein
MMTPQEIEQQIFELVEQKAFNELSIAEREMVLSVLSEMEYNAQHQLVKEAPSMLNANKEMLAPDLAIKHDLLTKIKAQNKRQWSWNWFTIELPIYQPAMAFTVLVLGWLFWFKPSPNVQYIEKERIVYQPKIDTVEVVKEIPIIQTQEVIRYVDRVVEVPTKSVELNAELQDNLAIGAYTPEEKPSLENLSNSLGNSSIEQRQLAQFRTRL